MPVRIAFCLVLLSAPAWADESWVGKVVISRGTECVVRAKPDPKTPAEAGFEPYLVVRDQGGWLELQEAGSSELTLKGAPGGQNTTAKLGSAKAAPLKLRDNVWGVKTHFVPLSEAKAFFDAQIKGDAKSESGYLGRARIALLENDDPDAALADIDRAIEFHPKSKAARRQRGALFDLCGANLGAVGEFTWLIEQDANDAHAFNFRAQAHASRGKHDLAIADYKEACRLQPDTAMFKQNLALALAGLGDTPGSIAAMDEAIGKYPNDAGLIRCRGLIRQDSGDFDGSLHDFDQCLKLRPDWQLARANRGWSHFLKNDHAKALADMDEAIAKGFRHGMVLNNRGFVKHKLGKYAEALTDFDAALEADPGLSAIIVSNRTHTALEIAQAKVKANPKDPAALVARAQAYIDRRDFEAASADCDSALQIDPKSAPAICERANICMHHGDVQGAIRNILECRRLDPANVRYVQHFAAFQGILLWAAGNRDAAAEAIREADKLVKAFPQVTNVWIHRGGLHLMSGEYDKCIADMTETIRLDPKQGSAWGSRASAYMASERLELALSDQLRSVELQPTLGLAWNSLGSIQMGLCRYVGAMRAYQRGASVGGAGASPEPGLTLAWLYATCPRAELRDGERAVELTKAIGQAISWGDSRAYSTLAAAYAETGDFEQAVQWEELALIDGNLSKETRELREARLKLYREKKPYRDDRNAKRR